MPEQELSYNEMPKDWEQDITPEQFEANEARMTNGWRIAQLLVPGSVLAAGVMYTQAMIDKTAYVPENQPNPAKAVAITALATAATAGVVKAGHTIYDRYKNREQEDASSGAETVK